MTQTGFKLLRVRRDGSLGPLFINTKQRIPIGVWLPAESHPTPGYAYRPGWHCFLRPVAPHLSMRGRRWYQVEIENYELRHRPEHQGGTWVLAQKLKVIGPVDEQRCTS